MRVKFTELSLIELTYFIGSIPVIIANIVEMPDNFYRHFLAIIILLIPWVFPCEQKTEKKKQ